MDEIKEKKGVNIQIGETQRFYKAIEPNIVTTNKNVLYFNADAEDNAYPQKLIDLYLNASSVHSNFINLKTNLMRGNGLEPVTPSVEWETFVKTKNKVGDDLQDIFNKACFDYSLFEAAALQVIYDSEGAIARVYHVDASYVRAEAPDEFGRVNYWLISKYWGDITNKSNKRATENNKAVRVAGYNPETWKEDGGVQLLYIKKYVAGSVVYAIPSYNSSTDYIQLDSELADFQLNKVAGGMHVNGMLYLNGDPDEEEKKEIERKIDRKFGGTKGRKVMLVFGTGQEERPVFESLEEKNEKLFNDLIAISAQKIATAHGGNLALAGIEGTGVDLGGDANKLNTSLAFYNKTTVKPMQTILLKGLNIIFNHNKLSEATVTYTPLVVEQKDETQLSETDTIKVIEKTKIKDLN